MAKQKKVMDVVPNKPSKKRKAKSSTTELGELVFENSKEVERPMEVPVEIAEPQEEIKKQPIEEVKKPKKTMKSPLKIIHILLTLAAAISVGILIFNISRSNLLPAKFFYPIVAVLIILMLIFLRLAFRRKTKAATRVVLSVLSLLCFVVSLFGDLKLGDTLAFLDQNLNGVSYQTLTYDVLTGADSKYDKAEDLKNTTITAPPDFSVSEDELKSAVKDQLGADLVFNDNIDDVTNLPLQDSDALILLGDSIYNSIIETASDYGEKTKIIATVKITKRVEKEDDGTDLASKPFLILLSGIDDKHGELPYTSLSDVNIAIAVNPKTAQILLVTIPRDYYVQLHGTTGLKDKLTHAGALGGVQLSKSTIEDLLGVKFDDYIRVNFGFVVGLVDAIGGITINSDWNTPITCFTDPSCVIQPGDNFVDGRCALAFSRERMAYNTGDTHRGENQQQVIEKIFAKLSSSSTLISRYSEILNSLNGTFETSVTSDDISSLVRLQLDSFPNWKIHSYTLAGTGGMDYTYSYPSQLLYVTYQDAASIAKAHQMIEEVLNGN
ncbi:LCP family protein [Candidatus Saccharibacteria bacterium]|nr:LCP family protein [Candidatus Saccharibacteria bacterium]